MPQKNEKENIQKVIHKLFEIAEEKIKDDKDKEVIQGLQQLVNQAEDDLFVGKPRYIDAFFFPDERNIARLVGYIKKAQKKLRICVFNFTNDDLCNAVLERHKAKVEV